MVSVSSILHPSNLPPVDPPPTGWNPWAIDREVYESLSVLDGRPWVVVCLWTSLLVQCSRILLQDFSADLPPPFLLFPFFSFSFFLLPLYLNHHASRPWSLPLASFFFYSSSSFLPFGFSPFRGQSNVLCPIDLTIRPSIHLILSFSIIHHLHLRLYYSSPTSTPSLSNRL